MDIGQSNMRNRTGVLHPRNHHEHLPTGLGLVLLSDLSLGSQSSIVLLSIVSDGGFSDKLSDVTILELRRRRERSDPCSHSPSVVEMYISYRIRMVLRQTIVSVGR
jgi:hypothetical protein